MPTQQAVYYREGFAYVPLLDEDGNEVIRRPRKGEFYISDFNGAISVEHAPQDHTRRASLRTILRPARPHEDPRQVPACMTREGQEREYCECDPPRHGATLGPPWEDPRCITCRKYIKGRERSEGQDERTVRAGIGIEREGQERPGVLARIDARLERGGLVPREPGISPNEAFFAALREYVEAVSERRSMEADYVLSEAAPVVRRESLARGALENAFAAAVDARVEKALAEMEAQRQAERVTGEG